MSNAQLNAVKLARIINLSEAKADGVTDDRAVIQSALDSADGIRKTIIDGDGFRYAVSAPLRFTKANTEFVNFVLVPTAGYDGGTIVYNDMGSGTGGETAGQKTNRGNPLIRMIRDDTGLSGEELRGCALWG